MSIYLPIGIGLFQAQNQQLLVVSRQQAEMIVRDDLYKPLPARPKGSIGGPKYYVYRLKIWWRDANKQRKYEAYVLIGMIVQVSQDSYPAMCDRTDLSVVSGNPCALCNL